MKDNDECKSCDDNVEAQVEYLCYAVAVVETDSGEDSGFEIVESDCNHDHSYECNTKSSEKDVSSLVQRINLNSHNGSSKESSSDSVKTISNEYVE